MYFPRWSNVHAALRDLIERVSDGDALSIVTFGEEEADGGSGVRVRLMKTTVNGENRYLYF